MATPRIFVSSTFYDLKYIRENIKYFIRTIGYEPVLSEEGDVFFNPKLHTHDSCLTEVPSSQMFILIIGGRYGGQYINEDKSITNMEYETAVKSKIPVFALVEASVYSEHHLYNENKRKNKKISVADIHYPSVDNIKIFDFIDTVRKNTINNALVPFRDFADIENYLRKQWAGMMFSYLNEDINERKIADTLAEMKVINTKIEYLSEQILKSVGTEFAKINSFLYEEILGTEIIRSVTFMNGKITPLDIIKHTSYEDCVRAVGINLEVEEKAAFTQTAAGKIKKEYFDTLSREYIELREKIKDDLQKRGYTFKKFLDEAQKSNPKLKE